MGTLVGAMQSQFLDGFEVTDHAAELLIQQGWTPPESMKSPDSVPTAHTEAG